MIEKRKLNIFAVGHECDQCDTPLKPGSIIFVNDMSSFFCSRSCAEQYETEPPIHGKVVKP